jgi:hypothetical protein
MATDRQLVQALVSAAESLLHRPLSQTEQNQLLNYFNDAQGSAFARAQAAVNRLRLIELTLNEKRAAASDDTDRIMNDLKNIVDQWKPGS